MVIGFFGIYFFLLPFFYIEKTLLLYSFFFIFIFFINLNIEKIVYKRIIYFIYTLFLLHTILLNINHYYSFFLFENDVVSMAEVLLETSKGHFFKSNYFGDMDNGNYLSHHFSPALSLLSPLFIIFPHRLIYTFSLIIFNFISLILIEKIANYNLKDKKDYLIFCLIPLFNPYFYNLFTSYHFESLFLTFFLVFLYGYLSGNKLYESLGFLLSITLKEDIPIYYIIFSVIFLLKKDYKRFIYLIVICLVYLNIINQVQLGLDRSAYVNWLGGWSQFGTDKVGIILNFFLKFDTLILLAIRKIDNLINLLISFSYLPVFSLTELIPCLSIFIIQSSSDRMWYNSFYNYYCYTILPFFIYSTLIGLPYLTQKNDNDKIKNFIYILLTAFCLYANKSDRQIPMKYQNVEEEKVRNVRAVIEKIPINSEVSTFFSLGMHLRTDISSYPLKKDKTKKFILVDTTGFSPYTSIEEINLDIEKNLKEKKILLYYSKNTVKLYKKTD